LGLYSPLLPEAAGAWPSSHPQGVSANGRSVHPRGLSQVEERTCARSSSDGQIEAAPVPRFNEVTGHLASFYMFPLAGSIYN
jgi:hypothetical protein